MKIFVMRSASAGADGRDVVTALIIEEYVSQGGDDITFPDDLCRKRQKLFRFWTTISTVNGTARTFVS